MLDTDCIIVIRLPGDGHKGDLNITLRCVIPVVCVTNEREESVVKQHNYEGHLESKERFAIKKYLLIIGKEKNMQVLSHTFTYFST